ncbi:MAG: CDP-alcohol phosphatidyltransferase family protein [Rhizobiales bacterium]|nr:CDP-alcohol phosphatidyltransferase family protein [Hyphomicrobiales bacterium]
MSLPNAITISRILIVPVTIWLILNHQFALALLAFLLAGISDAVDGFIARRFGLQSELGAYLDPIADKALLVSIYVSLAAMQHLPAWLAIIVVTRDVLIVGAVLLAWVLARPVEMRPLQISKVNTVAQLFFAGVLLLALSTQLALEAMLDAGEVLVAVLTLASGAVYMRNWVRHMSAPARKETS